MARLDKYRLAMQATYEGATAQCLVEAFDARESDFANFIVDHGLGPVWHSRTGREEFKDARRAAEALFLAQHNALGDIGAALNEAGVEYALIKGGANRYLLYENPALRACYDLDILVRPVDRVRAVRALVGVGFSAQPEQGSISREIVLSRDRVDVDLHWSILREGRLRHDSAEELLERRRKVNGVSMLHPDDALFVLLVHPAFGKHLSGWDMGLHRVADIIYWFRSQQVDWPSVHRRLCVNGVKTAAWATLRWVQILNEHPNELEPLLADTCPGTLRRRWIEHWLQQDLSARLANKHLLRLLGFTTWLHDSPRDAVRALAGRVRAWRRRGADVDVFRALSGE